VTFTSYDVVQHIREYVIQNYIHYTDSKVQKAATHGTFFPLIWANPSDFIIAQAELREPLRKLREQGAKLFVGTNSHGEFGNLIMTATLGPDWRDFFDFVSVCCGKPRYF